MIVVVTGIEGAQQGAVAGAFLGAGWTVRGTARKAAQVDGVEVRRADLSDAEALRDAFEGADVVAFTAPQVHAPGAITGMADAVARATTAAGVQHLIVNFGGTLDEAATHALATELKGARAAAREAGVPVTVLQPTVYMDNLLAPWAKPGIVEGGVFAYPAPPEAHISWLSHRSLADIFVAVAGRPDLTGEELRVGGPEPLTGPQMAATLAARLGRPVRYERVPLDAFAAGIDQSYGAPAGERLASIYARLEAEPDAMAVPDPGLGVRSESFEEFVERNEWKMT